MVWTVCGACGNYLFWHYSKSLRRNILVSDGDWPIQCCPSCGIERQEKSISRAYIPEWLWEICNWQKFYNLEKQYITSHIKFREDLLARMSLDPGSLRTENYDFLYDLDKKLGDKFYPPVRPSNFRQSEKVRDFSDFSDDELPF